MKKLFFLIATVWPCWHCFSQNNAAAKPANTGTSSKGDSFPSGKNSIALLGMYHFDNPNQDNFNINSDNVLLNKRQVEIEALVNILAKYKPTHIALEFNAADSTLDLKYQQYLKGNYTLGASEREQLGFRLAKISGHRHIYPVDAPDIRLDFDPGELAVDYGPLLGQLSKTGNSVVTGINEWLNKYTIGQVLANMNTPQFDQLNINLYYQYLLPIGKGNIQPGLEAVSRWYKRNLFILHHIMKLTENKTGNRVLVIFGQGHTAMLNQFLQYSDVFVQEDIRKYLPTAD